MGFTRLWDRHVLVHYAFIIFWLWAAAFSFYATTDYLFKAAKFADAGRALAFYAVRLMPFFLISMPVVAFLGLYLVIRMLRARRELYIARLACTSRWAVPRPLLAAGLLLTLLWTAGREVGMPALRWRLIDTQLEIHKDTLGHYALFSSAEAIVFAIPRTPSADRLRAGVFLRAVPEAGPAEAECRWTEAVGWSVDLLQPSAPELSQRRIATLKTLIPGPASVLLGAGFYDHFSLGEILRSGQLLPPRLREVLAAERLAFPFFFLACFSVSTYHGLRSGGGRGVWRLPAAGFLTFSLLVMSFRGAALAWGPGGAFLLFGALSLAAHLALRRIFAG